MFSFCVRNISKQHYQYVYNNYQHHSWHVAKVLTFCATNVKGKIEVYQHKEAICRKVLLWLDHHMNLLKE